MLQPSGLQQIFRDHFPLPDAVVQRYGVPYSHWVLYGDSGMLRCAVVGAAGMWVYNRQRVRALPPPFRLRPKSQAK
jgi:hypothetical protein